MEPGFVLELSKRLTSGFDIYVVAPHYKGAALHEVLDGVHVFRFRYWFTRWQTLAFEKSLSRALKRGNSMGFSAASGSDLQAGSKHQR